MNHQTRQTEQQHQPLAALEQSAQQQTAVEFATAEEMLGYDAARTPVPPVVAERLQRSVAQEPPPPRSWWQRLLKR